MIRRFTFTLILLTAALPLRAGAELTVFAAASLRDVIEDIDEMWDGTLRVSYGGSAHQARQVAAGAPADLVILANPQWMDWLSDQGVLANQTRVNLLSNRLVLIGPAGASPLPASLGSSMANTLLDRLGDAGRLAIGDTRAVPAGQYGKAWLQSSDMWPALSGRLAETENVRLALILVSLGEAPLGLVYASDALADPRVSVLLEVPAESHPEILYPAALTKTAVPDAQSFLTFLTTPGAADLFRRHGFTPVAPN